MSGDEEERALKKGKKFITCDDDERTEKHQKWNDDTHVFFKKIQETVVAKQELEDAEFDAGHEKDGDGDSPAKIKVRQARKKLGELREELKIARDLAYSSHVKYTKYSSVPFMEAVHALGMDDISLPTMTPMKKPPAVKSEPQSSSSSHMFNMTPMSNSAHMTPMSGAPRAAIGGGSGHSSNQHPVFGLNAVNTSPGNNVDDQLVERAMLTVEAILVDSKVAKRKPLGGIVFVVDDKEYAWNNCPAIVRQYAIYMMKQGAVPLKLDPENPGVLATPKWIWNGDWTQKEAHQAIRVLKKQLFKPEKWYPFDRKNRTPSKPVIPVGCPTNYKTNPVDTWTTRLAFVLYPTLFEVRKVGRFNKLVYLLDE